MAKVFYGTIITDMIGSVGGMSFQHNRSGKIVRQRPVQKKSNTVKQSGRIAAFNNIQIEWFNLSIGDKVDWNDFADAHDRVTNWNETKSVNGYNWFMSINSYLQLCGESLLTTPPTWLVPLTPGSYDATVSALALEIEFDPSFAHTDYYLFIWCSPVLRSAQVMNRKAYRLVKIVGPGTDTVIDLESDWESTFGVTYPVPGMYSGNAVLFAVQTVHKVRGLASPFLLLGEAYY